MKGWAWELSIFIYYKALPAPYIIYGSHLEIYGKRDAYGEGSAMPTPELFWRVNATPTLQGAAWGLNEPPIIHRRA